MKRTLIALLIACLQWTSCSNCDCDQCPGTSADDVTDAVPDNASTDVPATGLDTHADAVPAPDVAATDVPAPDLATGEDAAGEDVPVEEVSAPEVQEDVVETCPENTFDCNGDPEDGCEADLTSPLTCGDCDTLCAGDCVEGQCAPCDQGLAIDSEDPEDFARAIGICWGLSKVKWVQPDGGLPPQGWEEQVAFHLGHGLLDDFGPNVLPGEGNRLAVLSSGTARRPKDPGFQSPGGYDKNYSSYLPPGFPQESASCPGVVTGQAHDATAIELTVQVPDGATGFSFDSKFYTYEYPVYICSEFNDFFIALVSPPVVGANAANVVFDVQDNPISVNTGFLEVCEPGSHGGKTFTCGLGTSELTGTGFGSDSEDGNHGATGWLRTKAPLPNQAEAITLRFAVYDSGDGIFDSTALIDNFQWLTEPDVTLVTVPKT